MRILLRKISTGGLLACDEKPQWTRSVEKAVQFRRSQQAVRTASRLNLDLSDLELVFRSAQHANMIVRLHDHGSRVVQTTAE